MMYVYEVMKTNEDGSTRSHGVYRYESSANQYIRRQEKYRMSKLAHKIARLIGWKRGRDSARFQEIIIELGESPFTVKKINVQ